MNRRRWAPWNASAVCFNKTQTSAVSSIRHLLREGGSCCTNLHLANYFPAIASEVLGRLRLAAGPRGQGRPHGGFDRVVDASHRAIAEQEVHPLRVPAPE